MKMIKTIPALPVRDLARSLDFYHNQLGFTVKHEQEGMAVLHSGAVHLSLWVANDERWRERDGSSPIVSGAESFISGTASCRIQVEGVDELFQCFESQGILHPKSKLRDQWWGVRDFGMTDPDNNLLTFFEEIQ